MILAHRFIDKATREILKLTKHNNFISYCRNLIHTAAAFVPHLNSDLPGELAM